MATFADDLPEIRAALTELVQEVAAGTQEQIDRNINNASQFLEGRDAQGRSYRLSELIRDSVETAYAGMQQNARYGWQVFGIYRAFLEPEADKEGVLYSTLRGKNKSTGEADD